MYQSESMYQNGKKGKLAVKQRIDAKFVAQQPQDGTINIQLFAAYVAINCVYICTQSLSMNSDMSRLAINGHTKHGVEKLVGRIGYVNSHTKPLVGTSDITFISDVT